MVRVTESPWAWKPVPAQMRTKSGASASADEIRSAVNARLGKTQRLADLIILASLPRSHIGKVLKRELRDDYKGAALTQ